MKGESGAHFAPRIPAPQGAILPPLSGRDRCAKMRPRSEAATDRGRSGRV